MLDLSPVKVLVVLVVALVVLGPDKLPQLARQLGAAWGDFRRWRVRIESEVRGTFPDLPSTEKITDAVRSPLGFLDRLADEHEREQAGLQGGSGADETAEDGPALNGRAESAQSPVDLSPSEERSNGSIKANNTKSSNGQLRPNGQVAPEEVGTASGRSLPIPLDDPSMN
ncbi:MAG TPA: twin-arginine translocase TatA/TatE family subunit [Acidimicrobiales bacterium]|nr:twin-arginine translocase TatA/TatE family subunit [Acidimicrobiales bacterium]